MLLLLGAGLAGLICARELHLAGEEFLLLEAQDEPGGRVRSRRSPDGFTLDRGFQVLLESYPAVRRHLDLAALQPRYFDRGAILCDAARTWTLAHPLHHPADLPQTAFGDVFPLPDRLRLAALVAELLVTPDATLLAEGRSPRDVSTAHYLLRRGFSSQIIERFWRPFFGGVLLEDRLATSASLFRYYLKKFATGRALLPARGMGEITRQLASGLPADALRLNCRVESIESDGKTARAAVTAAGERIPCSRLVLATDGPATDRLLGRAAPRAAALGVTVVYFASGEPVYPRPLLALPAGRGRLTRNFTQLTNVAPEYAPPGRCLLAASVLDRPGRARGRALAAAVQAEIAAIFPAARALEHLETLEVPYAQHPHPAGYGRSLAPTPAPTPWSNAWLAGDQTSACSIQTAMDSGERMARFLLGHQGDGSRGRGR